MQNLFKHPVILLLSTGTLLGLNFPLGVKAAQANIPPTSWAFIVSFGACLLLLPKLIIDKDFHFPRKETLKYVLISGTVSYILPNLLLFSVMAQLGSGYMGIMFALSPVFTLLLAVIFHMKTSNKLGVWGVAIGLIGAIIISLQKTLSFDAPHYSLIIAALGVPICLALGNIYRTKYWPESETPDSLAFWGHGFATMLFLGLIFLSNTPNLPHHFANAPVVMGLQIVVSGLTYPLFFRLQKIGGPVLLSQIGYVAAGISLVFATLILGEHYSQVAWFGAAIVGLGIMFTIRAQIQ